MEIAQKPADEAERLVVLDSLRVLDTPPEPFFDEIAEIARAVAGVKSAMVAMIDGERKWLKACSGGALGESPRDLAFCAHTILQDEVMWVEDSRQDPRFHDHPLVTGPKRVHFYAGAPIIVAGHKVGTLCLNDEAPRPYDATAAAGLKRLASLVASQLAGRRMQMMSASVMDASADAIVCADAGRRILFWNPAAERMFGYRSSEAVGRELDLLVAETLDDEARAIWSQALDLEGGGRPAAPLEMPGRRKDGGSIRLEITFAEWRDGRRPGISLILRDCSERRRAAEALQQALTRAEAANLAKTEFLANMSHEIRTPLNGVLGVAQLMAFDELTEAQAERVEIIRRSGDELLGLLNNLLDTARIESGRVDLEMVEFDLTEAIAQACEGSAMLAEAKGVGFEVRTAPALDGPWIGDPGRLRQIIRNLTSNAVKFTASGRVVVEAERESHGSEALKLTVSDTGVGIPEEALPRLFEKFVQGDSSTTRTFGGSGLGLTICRDLLALMGGEIEVSSRPGVGAEFSFRLPLTRAQAGSVGRAAA